MRFIRCGLLKLEIKDRILASFSSFELSFSFDRPRDCFLTAMSWLVFLRTPLYTFPWLPFPISRVLQKVSVDSSISLKSNSCIFLQIGFLMMSSCCVDIKVFEVMEMGILLLSLFGTLKEMHMLLC